MPAKKRTLKRENTPDAEIAPKKSKKAKPATLPVVESVRSKGRPRSPAVLKLAPFGAALEDREVGVVLTLGQNDVGQLGLGQDISEKKKPSLVEGLDDVIALCCGGMHTVCLHKSGEVSTFGCNDAGALGRDTSVEGSEFEPARVKLDGKAVQVTAGDSHSAVLLEDGRVFAWGSFRDSSGDMGLTVKGPENKPVHILKGVEVAKISSGDDHLVMLSSDGLVYTCGCGEQGQLGRITERSASRKSRHGIVPLLTPAAVDFHGKKTAKNMRCDQVWTGSYCTFARDANSGAIYAFGLNNYRQIGFPKEEPQFRPLPAEVFSEHRWQQISGGQHHTLALDEEGNVYSLGRHDYGRLGLGEDCDVTSKPTPLPALKGKKCIQVASGSVVSFALTEDGKVYAWGMGTNCQLGTSEEDDVHTPLEMAGKQLEGRKSLMIAAGGQHTAIIAKSTN